MTYASVKVTGLQIGSWFDLLFASEYMSFFGRTTGLKTKTVMALWKSVVLQKDSNSMK